MTNSSTGAPTARLTTAKLRKMIYEAQNLVKEHENLKAQAQEPARKDEHVVWEVYAGRGQLSEEVNKLEGCSARKFGIEQGWDFSRPKDRKSFIKLLIDEEPGDVHISPECRLWSPLQELTASRSEEARQFLIDSRTVNHDTHLVFVATVYKIQQRAGRNATIEHPWPSRAWQTKAFMPLVGFSTYIDQCELGLELPNDYGVVLPVKKPTCLLTTRRNLFYHMLRFACSGNHQHTPCEGYIQGRGLRSRLCQDYPYEMAYELAHCMTQREETVAEINAAEDGDAELLEFEKARDEPLNPEEDKDCEMVKANRELKKKVGARAVDYVARLHKNLGHPSPEVLVKMLTEVQATENVLQAAREYVCRNCYHRAKPFQVPPSGGISSTTFGNRLVVDSSWIQLEAGRQCVLTMCDEATRYIAVRILQSEKSTEFVKGLERT